MKHNETQSWNKTIDDIHRNSYINDRPNGMLDMICAINVFMNKF